MGSRARRWFRPGVAALRGADLLEDRRLLSAHVVAVVGAGIGDGDGGGRLLSVHVVAGPVARTEIAQGETISGAIHGETSRPDDAVPAPPVDLGSDASSPDDEGMPDEGPLSPSPNPPASPRAGDDGPFLAAGLAPGTEDAVELPLATTMAPITPGPVYSGRSSPRAGPRPADDGLAALGPAADGSLEKIDGPPVGVARPFPSMAPSLAVEASRSEGDGPAVATGAEPEPPPPRAADLLTDFLPFDRATVEAAIDRFLAPIDDLGTELATGPATPGAIPSTMLVAAAAMAVEAARRRARDAASAADEGDVDLDPFPGHPATWGLRES